MTIFISKDEQDLGIIPRFLEDKDIKGVYSSLIHFEKVFFQIPSDFEVIFFPSARSAQFMIDSKEINLNSYVLACSGPQTNERLIDLGYHCAFIGANAGSPDQVSKDFGEWLGDRKVFIPHSNRSVLSMIVHIPNHQVVSKVVYNTILSDAIIDSSDLYVFSSPSNIHSFFKKNRFKKDSLVIVWGQTSARCLNEYNCKADFILQDGTLQELHRLIYEILESRDL
jgi:uroporphyrinogen-III synthase